MTDLQGKEEIMLIFITYYLFSPMALRPNAGHDLLILKFLDHTQRRITFGRTSLDE